jgi:hypothetical protein
LAASTTHNLTSPQGQCPTFANLSEWSFPPEAQFSFGSSQMMIVIASRGICSSSRTFVNPSTIFFLSSKLIPDQTFTWTTGKQITSEKGGFHGYLLFPKIQTG